MYRWLSLLALVALALGAWIYRSECTFDVSKIHSDLCHNSDWEASRPDDVAGLREVLSKPFTFLGRGAQFYAFLSEDGQHVLKLFKHHHLNTSHPLDRLPIPPVQRYLAQRRGRRELRRSQLFQSCHLASEELREETGLILAHLNKTMHEVQVRTRIEDRFGKWHIVDLDQQEFLLQEYATPVVISLDKRMQQGDLSGAQETIDSILSVIANRCDKGVRDLDPAFLQNYGICQDRAIQFDVGSLARYELVRERPYRDQEILMKTKQLRSWILDHYPQLLPHFEDSLYHNLQHPVAIPTPVPKPLEQWQRCPGAC